MIYAAFLELRKRKNWVICYFMGIILGAILANVVCKLNLKSIKDFSENIIGKIDNKKAINIVTWDIFCFRLKEMLVINVFALTIIWKKFSAFYIVYKGMIFSIAESLMIFIWGKEGIEKYFMLVIKYYPLYMFTIIITMILCEYIHNVLFGKNVVTGKNYKNETVIKYVISSVIIITLLFLESILESNINNSILV